MRSIKKAVFPIAGLGTRLLPFTKAVPKEMMPIMGKPLIQHSVEEALDAGCKTLIFVTSDAKPAIRAHFEPNLELEKSLINSIATQTPSNLMACLCLTEGWHHDELGGE